MTPQYAKNFGRVSGSARKQAKVAHSLIGVDEVGRGAWAGPLLVVAARTKTDLPNGLRDSKTMSRDQREKILTRLNICCEFGEGWVSAAEIDRLGLAAALRLGVKRALIELDAQPDEQIIMDGKTNYVPTPYTNVKCLVSADSLIPIVSAAGIHAKVTRDRFMQELGKTHPGYYFEQHVGYGTKAHQLALQKLGTLKRIHRLSFAPVNILVVNS